MIIKNNLPKEFIVLLDGKEYRFAAGDSMEVSEKIGKLLIMLQPLLVAEAPKSVKIEGKPEEIKVKKDVVKNKKSRK